MKVFLSTKHQVQLEIMEIFLEQQQSSLEELEETTGASKQTVLRYIEELEQMTDFFQIQKKKSELYLLKNNRINYSAIYHYFYQHSLQFKLLELVLLQPFLSTTDILDQLDISKSQFRRIKKQLSECLEYYGVTLTDSPFHFTGEFSKLCNFFVTFITEKYFSLKEFINEEEAPLIEQIVQGFSNLPHLSGFQDYQRLKVWIWVVIKMSSHFPRLVTTTEFLDFDNYQIVINNQKFEHVFKIPYTGFVHSTLSKLHYMLKKPILSPEMNLKKDALNHLYKRLYELFGNQTFKEVPMVFDTSLSLYQGRSHILNHAKKRFVFEFFKQNGSFSSLISQQLKKELTVFRGVLRDDDLFFDLLYLMLTHDPVLTNLIIKNQQKKTVGILYTFDEEHSNMLAKRFEHIFEDYLTFEVIDFHTSESVEEKLDNYDFCLTNFPTLNKKNCIVSDIFPTDKDIQYLNHLFQQSILKELLEDLKKPLPVHQQKPPSFA
ncbi:M protein trans-acting positive regulator [Enterococcus faecalis 13-SD-W-01]|nr:M protein trans-acting positive regulator [Enterococcus faecalis 13-SD-W-01]